MKKLEKLSKAEMKKVKGGGGGSCLVIGSPCTYNAQCCPNFCLMTPNGGVCANP
jgi:hypothetical protein